jgi:hypothetical protein
LIGFFFLRLHGFRNRVEKKQKRCVDCHARTQELAGGFKRARENPKKTRPGKEKAAARAKKRVSSSRRPVSVLSASPLSWVGLS